MVIVPIHQVSSSIPPLSTPIIDLLPLKPVSPLIQEPIITATTTTTLPPPPPLLPQSTTDPDLANLNEVVKEAVHNALQAPLRERLRDLSEFQMKEILHDRMFESGSYRSYPDHTTLYKAFEVSMQHDNNDELHEALATSRKRRRDDQDPPPPPPKDSDPPSSSSKKKHASLFIQTFDDNLIPEDMHLSESEDTGAAHLPKIKTRPDWLKPVQEEDTSKTPEPDWVIPPNDLPETEVHKFSDGTLTRILEKLDYMVKDYELFKLNPGMENMIWTEDDKWRSQEFIKLIERRLKIRRIFRSLERFVSGRLRNIDYRLINRTE
ncbi:hypothetical protein Tco_0839088 [Tanacetum coccineum]|uniref:Uncharacterized protein n=1 Tax=Tanacetum coccineum TaxID=301880 RepID=A0ABQ5APN2_9ASTR